MDTLRGPVEAAFVLPRGYVVILSGHFRNDGGYVFVLACVRNSTHSWESQLTTVFGTMAGPTSARRTHRPQRVGHGRMAQM